MSEPKPIRVTIPITVQAGTKILRLERVLEPDYGDKWIIWLSANMNFTLGNYLVLNMDGSIENCTQHADGTETSFTVKEPD